MDKDCEQKKQAENCDCDKSGCDKESKQIICDGHELAIDGRPEMCDGYHPKPSGCASRSSQAG